MDPCNRPRICNQEGVTCVFRPVRVNSDNCGNAVTVTERVTASIPGGIAPIGDPRCPRIGKRR